MQYAQIFSTINIKQQCLNCQYEHCFGVYWTHFDRQNSINILIIPVNKLNEEQTVLEVY